VITLDQQEMYGEFFDIPVPEELVFISSFTGGEVFRSGCCFQRGKGKIFYFGPGHETHPIYRDPAIQQVIANAVRWAAPDPNASGVVMGLRESPIGWFESASEIEDEL
jgi:trehalose utilization protein